MSDAENDVELEEKPPLIEKEKGIFERFKNAFEENLKEIQGQIKDGAKDPQDLEGLADLKDLGDLNLGIDLKDLGDLEALQEQLGLDNVLESIMLTSMNQIIDRRNITEPFEWNEIPMGDGEENLRFVSIEIDSELQRAAVLKALHDAGFEGAAEGRVSNNPAIIISEEGFDTQAYDEAAFKASMDEQIPQLQKPAPVEPEPERPMWQIDPQKMA